MTAAFQFFELKGYKETRQKYTWMEKSAGKFFLQL
ncbi:hypothetical protein GGQ65_003487 [Rhizobium fabae]|uniref:Uncharacterized protein n=1 Tax=Rhizobium fabae TaxID=573179 RepID=A0A7W6BC84_9HYPH|nr:hypothetical protein [Rhizobium fabae]